tara:strand:- start:103 stop:726 length:624 start_codon:yes stop_codon:yes gene_type:complete
MKNINNYVNQYSQNGTCYIESNSSPFTLNNLIKMNDYCAKVPKEFVEIGDAGESNHLLVGRFQTDIEEPKLVNRKYSEEIFKIINSIEVLDFIKQVINYDGVLYVRRIQFNKIEKGCFIGYHLDIDSNPDYLAAGVIQFGDSYEGGLYRVYKPNSKKEYIDYKTKKNSLIISNCLFPHEVTEVKSGSRETLVFFVSNHKNKNNRYKS